VAADSVAESTDPVPRKQLLDVNVHNANRQTSKTTMALSSVRTVVILWMNQILSLKSRLERVRPVQLLCREVLWLKALVMPLRLVLRLEGLEAEWRVGR